MRARKDTIEVRVQRGESEGREGGRRKIKRERKKQRKRSGNGDRKGAVNRERNYGRKRWGKRRFNQGKAQPVERPRCPTGVGGELECPRSEKKSLFVDPRSEGTGGRTGGDGKKERKKRRERRGWEDGGFSRQQKAPDPVCATTGENMCCNDCAAWKEACALMIARPGRRHALRSG